MSDHVLAIATYGSQRVKHPRTGQLISAYKIGYSTAAADVLLAVCPTAEDVSSRHASYRYVRLADATIRHGYLLVKVTAEALSQAETLTRQTYRAGVFLWRDDNWWSLPNEENDYAEPISHSGPSFNPAGLLALSAETGERESAVSGIQIERSQRDGGSEPWWWISGDTYPHRDLLRLKGCRWSKKRKAWYFIGAALPAEVQALVDATPNPAPTESEAPIEPMAATPTPIVEQPIEPVDSPVDASSEAEIAHIRIVKPTDQPDDALTNAVRDLRPDDFPLKNLPVLQSKALQPIPQTYCGELTGSITGQVFCYGYAVHNGICVYLNLAGPRSGVEAIRAKLSKGDIVTVVPEDAPAIELTAGEGNSGRYQAFVQTIPAARFTSMILAHEWLANPNYGGKSVTFILHISDEQAMAQLKQHVTELVNVPVFEAWTGYLWQAGQAAMLVSKAHAEGGLTVWKVELDGDAWTRLTTTGLQQRLIALPAVEVQSDHDQTRKTPAKAAAESEERRL